MGKKNTLKIAVLLNIFVFSVSFADNASLENYKKERKNMNLVEQRAYAKEKISSESDSEVLKEALEDVLKYSSTKEENNDALYQVEIVQEKLSDVKEDHQKVMLYKGRVLLRLERMEEGNAIFNRAYKEKWPQYQFENERSLLERADFAGAALQEFDRVSGRMYGDYYQVPPYEEGIEDLGLYKLYLARLKKNNPDIEAINSVINKLSDAKDSSPMKEFALALCHSEYGQFEEAWEIINELEANKDLYSDSPAMKDISLYKSMILLDEGKDIPAAQKEFQNYMEAHGDNYKVIYTGGDRFARSLESIPEKIAKTDEITTLLIESPIIQDESVKSTFTDYEISHLYDMHQMGLAWSGKLDESAEIAKQIYANYFPNLPAAACGLTYAIYLSWHNGGDLVASMNILNAIEENAPHDTVMPFIKISQAEILLKKGLRFQALDHVQKAMMRCLIKDGGSHEEAMKMAIDLQNRIFAE